MAAELLVGAVVDDGVSRLSNLIIHVLKHTWLFKRKLTRIQNTIRKKKPYLVKIEKRNQELGQGNQETEELSNLLAYGEGLVLKCEHIKWNLWKRYTHSKKLDKFNARLLDFCQTDLPLATFAGQKDLEAAIMKKGDPGRWSSGVPSLKGGVIGLDHKVSVLKAMVFNDSPANECSVVVVSAPGGWGKTTLVTKLCHDPDIKGKFGSIYFVTISQTPNLITAIKKLLGVKENDFSNEDDAIKEWGSFLNDHKSDDILLVLDDVWSHSIINRFKFNLPKYKILATSRYTFTQFNNTYQLQLLSDPDATELFTYYSALSERGNKDMPDDDPFDKLVKCCKNHPLVLEVVGGLLKGQHTDRWLIMLENLSDGKQHVLDLNKSEIEDCLARSLDILEPEIKECLLDLGLFPEDQKISATMLMDMWIHFYNHDEGGLATIDPLRELSYKNLATLLPIGENPHVIANKCEEREITQHDLLRTLSIRASNKQEKRLIVNANDQDVPQLPQTVNAITLSISTDESFPINWNDIQAPKVEVLVLNFMSKIHPLPQSIQTMKNLKVLIITNYGYNFSDLQNFPSPHSLTGFTTLRLEHVSISSISASILELAKLRKLSLITCQIGNNSFNEYIPNKLTALSEIDIDSCDDLNTFPQMFCKLYISGNVRMLLTTFNKTIFN